MNSKPSLSEDHGITVLSDKDGRIYSVGISTGGVAEIRMAQSNPKRHIIATTIDGEGLAFAQQHIIQQQFDGQITAKLEDITQPLPYESDYFDYVYARLVLHYLPKKDLQQALQALHRVLKLDGKLFVVVRSVDCISVARETSRFDPETHMTTCIYTSPETGKTHSYSRYFHTQDSIRGYVEAAGFEVVYSKAFDEQLYVDFMRTEVSAQPDNLIELLAIKK